MVNRFVLEICVQSVDHALAAERAGAQRIELCCDLPSGGITPSAGLMQTARRHLRIPIHVLIRPRPGDFSYSASELEVMRNDIVAAKHFGMDGIVLGILQPNLQVDVERTKELVKLAHPLPVTFHRAFDEAENLETAVEEVIRTGASRILTSGAKARATDAVSTLTRLVQAAGNRIIVMPCGGINSENIVTVVRQTQAQEIHTSAGTSNPVAVDDKESRSAKAPSFPLTFEQKVAKLVSLLGGVEHDELVR